MGICATVEIEIHTVGNNLLAAQQLRRVVSEVHGDALATGIE